MHKDFIHRPALEEMTFECGCYYRAVFDHEGMSEFTMRICGTCWDDQLRRIETAWEALRERDLQTTLPLTA